MKLTYLVILPLLCGVWTPLPAQEPGSGNEPPKAGQRATAERVQSLIEELGASDFEAREEAERKLRKLGDDAREALQKAAEDHADPEVRMRARRVLGQDDAESGSQGLRPRDGGRRERDDSGDVESRMQSMLDRMEQLFGGDEGPLPELRSLQEEMRRMQERLLQQPGLRALQDGLGHGTSVQIGPDGVRVEIEERGADGAVEEEVYEAESMEAFRREYPDVAERVFGRDGGLRIVTPWSEDGEGDGAWRRLRGLRPRGLTPPQEPQLDNPQAQPPAPGERLGVMVGPVPPEVGAYLGLEPGVGLVVGEVSADSLGAALGLQERDVLVRIEDVTIRGVGDVRRALRGIAKGEPVEVEIRRPGAAETLHTTKQHDAPDAGDDNGDGETSGKLRRRRGR